VRPLPRRPASGPRVEREARGVHSSGAAVHLGARSLALPEAPSDLASPRCARHAEAAWRRRRTCHAPADGVGEERLTRPDARFRCARGRDVAASIPSPCRRARSGRTLAAPCDPWTGDQQHEDPFGALSIASPGCPTGHQHSKPASAARCDGSIPPEEVDLRRRHLHGAGVGPGHSWPTCPRGQPGDDGLSPRRVGPQGREPHEVEVALRRPWTRNAWVHVGDRLRARGRVLYLRASGRS
jgi:hypothetical protein